MRSHVPLLAQPTDRPTDLASDRATNVLFPHPLLDFPQWNGMAREGGRNRVGDGADGRMDALDRGLERRGRAGGRATS